MQNNISKRKRAACNTREGANIVMEAIESSRFSPLQEMMDPSWWTNKDCKSFLAVSCDECGFQPRSLTVDKFMRTRSGSCWCNGQAPWASDEGLKRLKRIVNSSRFDLMPSFIEEEFVLNGNCNMHLPLVCSVCSFSPPRCLLRHFKDTATSACFCNGEAPWSSESGRQRLLSECEKFGVVPGANLLDAEWFKTNVHGKNSNIPLHCRHCSALTTTTSIDNFVRRGEAGCHCSHKTELMVYQFLMSIDGITFDREVDLKLGKSAKGGAMPYDFVGYVETAPLLIVELDGRQHFEELSNWNNATTLQNDIVKETNAVAAGIPIVRLHQPSVWKGCLPWQDFLTSCVTAAIHRTLEVRVHCQPGCSAYSSGLYARMRGKDACSRASSNVV